MIGGDFAKFCGLLRIYELYNSQFSIAATILDTNAYTKSKTKMYADECFLQPITAKLQSIYSTNQVNTDVKIFCCIHFEPKLTLCLRFDIGIFILK